MVGVVERMSLLLLFDFIHACSFFGLAFSELIILRVFQLPTFQWSLPLWSNVSATWVNLPFLVSKTFVSDSWRFQDRCLGVAWLLFMFWKCD